MERSRASKPTPTVARRSFLKTSSVAAAAALLGAKSSFAQSGVDWWDAKPSKSTRPLSIDVHAHWAPKAYVDAVHEFGHMVESHPMYSDLEARIKWMDAHGVAMHLLSLDGSAPWAWVSSEQGMRLAKIVNDAAVEAHTAHPTRIIATVAAPVKDPSLTLQELNRMAGKPGMRALHLPDSVDGHDYLFEPNFAPVLARCEELGYPLVFHQIGGGTVRNERTSGQPNLGAAIDAPYDHMVIATKFVVTGTLDKFPKLEIILPHAGGDFPWLAARVDHFNSHYFLDRGPSVNLPHPFRYYLRRFHYDYLTYYPEGFRYLLNLVGADRILVGTDSFAAMDIQYPSAVIDQFNLAPADKDRILFGNAKRLFHLT